MFVHLSLIILQGPNIGQSVLVHIYEFQRLWGLKRDGCVFYTVVKFIFECWCKRVFQFKNVSRFKKVSHVFSVLFLFRWFSWYWFFLFSSWHRWSRRVPSLVVANCVNQLPSWAVAWPVATVVRWRQRTMKRTARGPRGPSISSLFITRLVFVKKSCIDIAKIERFSLILYALIIRQIKTFFEMLKLHKTQISIYQDFGILRKIGNYIEDYTYCSRRTWKSET